ncbi:MAG: PTS sugar transporter subunit IIA [Spirochaetota bacterium]
MALIDLISEDVIKVPLTSSTKEGIFAELIDLLKAAGKIQDPQATYQAVIEREDLMSTALEDGIAVPHAKTNAVDRLTMAIGILPQGADCQSLDGKPSYVFFLILAPPDQSGPHIEALSEIASATKSSAFRRLLISANSPHEVMELFRDE